MCMADPHRRDVFPAFESGQDIRDRTFDFACRVVSFCQKVYAEGRVSRTMVPQLLNCSTSVAANLEEARAAQSDADFISKCCISLKNAANRGLAFVSASDAGWGQHKKRRHWFKK